MGLRTKFRAPREMCYAIQTVCSSQTGKLVARPWNRTEPHSTSWWLVPSSDWPAYKHGKFFFDWNRWAEGSIFAGLYVEKGLGRSISSAYPSAKGSRHIIQQDWVWHDLVRDLENSDIPLVIHDLGRQIPAPLLLRIDGGYVDDPSDPDPQGHKDKCARWEDFLLEWDPRKEQFSQREGEPAPERILSGFGTDMSMDDLARALIGLSQNEWIWIDLFLAVEFQILPRVPGKTSEEVWGAQELMGRFLRHLLPWLR